MLSPKVSRHHRQSLLWGPGWPVMWCVRSLHRDQLFPGSENADLKRTLKGCQLPAYWFLIIIWYDIYTVIQIYIHMIIYTHILYVILYNIPWTRKLHTDSTFFTRTFDFFGKISRLLHFPRAFVDTRGKTPKNGKECQRTDGNLYSDWCHTKLEDGNETPDSERSEPCGTMSFFLIFPHTLRVESTKYRQEYNWKLVLAVCQTDFE